MNNIMEKMNTPIKTPDGLFKFGFVANLKNGVYIKELQEKLSDTTKNPHQKNSKNEQIQQRLFC